MATILSGYYDGVLAETRLSNLIFAGSGDDMVLGRDGAMLTAIE